MGVLRSVLLLAVWPVGLLVAVPAARGVPTSQPARPLETNNAQYGFSFTLPPGWIEVPRLVVQSRGPRFVPGKFEGKATIVAAYQPAYQRGWLSFPNAVVMVLPYAHIGITGPATDDEVAKVAAAICTADLSRDLLHTANPLLHTRASAVLSGPPRLNLADSQLTFFTTVSAKRLGTYRGQAVAFFGRNAVTEVLLTARQEEWARYAPAAWDVADSFRFDADTVRQRPGPATATPPAPLGAGDIVRGVIATAIVSAIVFLVLSLIKRPDAPAATPPRPELVDPRRDLRRPAR
jgi:hypothetical protein